MSSADLLTTQGALRTLGVVTARGGSKGIPRKNIRLLCGKPLLQYTAEAALAARCLTRVVLSTDDKEIADTGRACGLEVPFMRPAELARDDTPTLPVIQHVLQQLEEQGEHYDAVCLLQPTNPLRRSQDINRCIELLESRGADAVVSILPVPHSFNPHWVYLEGEDGTLRLATGEQTPIPRRQELPPAYHRDGSVYVTRHDVLLKDNSLYGKRLIGYPVDPRFSINIDTPEDWLAAEALLSRGDDDLL